MYKYEFTKANIKFQDDIDISTAKVEIIEHTADMIHTKMKFSNGLEIEQILSLGKCIIESNCPVITDENGNLTFDFSNLQK
jgi:hypothetical protein